MVAEGGLAPAQAAPLLAAARGDVVSVRGELRALLGLAVAAVTTAVGLLIAEYRDHLGPLPVAGALAIAAAGTLLVVVRRSPPFTWGRATGRDWTLDGLLLLAVGLLGAELAWIESQFEALGAGWPLHLLVMAITTGALAVRFDSATAWTLALSTFAAWRGVSIVPTTAGELERALLAREDRLRGEMLLCALCFFLLGRLAERYDRKRQFEPATTMLALLAAGLGLLPGLASDGTWPLWALMLAAVGLAAAAWAFRRRRRGLLALGGLWAWIALTRSMFAVPGVAYFGCFWAMASTVGAIVALALVHRHFRAQEGR
jgi:hypothetical protein